MEGRHENQRSTSICAPGNSISHKLEILGISFLYKENLINSFLDLKGDYSCCMLMEVSPYMVGEQGMGQCFSVGLWLWIIAVSYKCIH